MRATFFAEGKQVDELDNGLLVSKFEKEWSDRKKD